MCSPTPRVEWSRADGKPLNNRMRVTFEGRGTELEITNVEMDDEGIYRCSATNRAGYQQAASVDIRLLVHCTYSFTYIILFNDLIPYL